LVEPLHVCWRVVQLFVAVVFYNVRVNNTWSVLFLFPQTTPQTSTQFARCEEGEDWYSWLCDTTDAGPDQTSRRRKLDGAFENCLHTFYTSLNCCLHQFHIKTKEGLDDIDATLASINESHPAVLCGFTKYFSSLGRISNTWRDKASAIGDSWDAHFGASKDGRRYPLQVVPGRWGSTDGAEGFHLHPNRGQHKIKTVLQDVLSNAFPKKEKVNANKELDDDGHHDTKQYQAKVSRWVSGTLAAVSCPVFWFLLEAAHFTRSPWRHFYLWIQKHSKDKCMLRLITGQLEVFTSEFEHIVSSIAVWFPSVLSNSKCTRLPQDVLNQLAALCFRLAVRNAASFHRRVVLQLDRQV
jgi:hypothetical protein